MSTKHPRQPAQPVNPSAKRAPLLMALEPRIMFDGAMVASATDAVHIADPHIPAAAQSETSVAPQRHDTPPVAVAEPIAVPTSQPAGPRTEVVFIDTAVRGWELLRDGVQQGTEVILLDANTDGLQQMLTALDGRTNIDTIHILSHGAAGQLHLGNLSLDSTTMAARTADLATLGASLSADGDILLYGCNIAANAEGIAFIGKLAVDTQADIAASTDLTGAAARGGDWLLEARTGTVVDQSPLTDLAMENYDGVLALVNNGADGNIGWDAIASNANIAGGTTGRTGGEVISVTNLRSTGFDVYAKNDAGASTNFLLRELISGMTGGAGASYVRVNTATGFSPQWLELRANQGMFDLGSIKVGSADSITATTYDFTLQALDSSFNPVGTAVTLNSVARSNYGTFSVANNTDFDGIYGVRITVNTGSQIAVDDISITSPRMAAPTLVSANFADTNLKIGETSLVTFVFSEAVTGFGLSDLTIANGNLTTPTTSDGGTTWTANFTPNTSITDATNVITVNLTGVTSVATSQAGVGTADSGNYAIDTLAPTVSSVSATTNNGTYQVGDPVDITVTFNDNVTVTGTPQLTLETGATDQVANYLSGSGGSTLTFRYTVQAGDTSADLDYLSTSALALNGGSIRDSSGNDAALTLAAPGTAGSLGANKNIVIDTNVAPSIGNLNGDSVAWAGAGNTVTLDSGGNATISDAELGALNGGNGNWTGASLTIQRASTALASDIFGFNTAGGLFTLAGISASGNLQVSGLTFATYSNSGGVLTINFTSTDILATTALVNNVAQRITYRSDTPAGDATISITANDGALSSTAANVTVTSDTIYVTNTSSTATIDITDGVSFSEAVAIAAADATGSQTIVLANSLAGLTVSTAVTSLGESLTLDMDQASGATLSGGTLTIGSPYTLTINNGTGDTATVSTSIDGSGGVTKTGAGSITFSSVGGNGYTGTTTISAGTLTASGGNAIANTSSVSIASGASLSLAANEMIGNLSGAGTINLGSNTLTTTQTANTTFSGSSSGTGGLTINQTGAATYALTLSGNMAHTGQTQAINYGWLRLDGEGAVSSSSTLRANGFGTITLLSDQTVGSLVGNGVNANVQLGSYTLTAGGDNTSTSLAGSLSGAGSLVKQGSGTLTLAGTNVYDGTTTVAAGTLSVASDGNLGSGALTLAGGSTLAVTGATTIDNAVTLSGAATIDTSANATVSGAISGAYNLTKTGASTLTLSGANSYSATHVAAGTLSVASDANLGSDTITLDNGTTLAITGMTTIDNAIALAAAATISNSANVTLAGVVSGSGTLTKTGASTLALGGTNTHTGDVTVSAGGLTVTGGSAIGNTSAVALASGTTLTLAGAAETIGSLAGAGNVVLNYTLNTGSNNTSTTFSGVISGTNNGIIKAGSGTLTLTGNNTYTGSTTVSAGGLTLNRVGGALADGTAVTLASGATLTVSASDTVSTLSGAGTVALGSQELKVGVNGGNSTFSGAITGSGTLTQDGTGTLALSGNNSAQSWATQVYDGALSIADDSNLGSGSVTLNDATLMITGATTIDNAITLANTATLQNTAAANLSGVVSGTGSLVKTGASALTLSNTNSYTGTTSVAVGNLLVTGALDGTTGITVASGATLGGTGLLFANASTNTLTVNSGGTLSPGTSVGTLTVNGNLNLASGSTLAVEINGATAGSGYDQLVVIGTVNISNSANLSVTHGYTPGLADSYTIIDNNAVDPISGTFSGLAEGATVTAAGNNTVLTASYMGATGNDFTLTAPANSAPILGNLNGDSTSFTEGDTPVAIDSGTAATVTDSDSNDFDGGNLTVAISANRHTGEDVLGFATGGSVSLSAGTTVGSTVSVSGVAIGNIAASGTGTGSDNLIVTFNSNATAARVTALVNAITYSNTNTTEPDTAARTLSITVNDGDGGTSASADVSVSVTAVNDAPTLTATGGTPTYTENGTPVDLFSGVTISTVETGQTITQLSLTVSNLSDGSAEILHADGTAIALTNGASGTTATNGMTYSVSVSAGVATVTLDKVAGLSSAAAATLVDGLGYSNSSEAPSGTNRVVTLASIQDNGGTSNGGVNTTSLAIAATVIITAVNDAPSITAPGSINITEDVPGVLAGISFSDVDAGNGTVTVTLGVASGSLSATTGAGVTVAGSGSTGLTLTGSISDINAFIAASQVSFTTAANATGNVTLTISIDDGGNTGTDPGNSGTGSSEADSTTLTLVVGAVNDAPVNGIPAPQSLPQDGSLTFNTGNGNLISISDVDAGGNSLEVTLTATQGALTLGSTTGLVFITGSGTGDTTMTFTGTASDINTALNGLVFSPTAGYNGAASIQVITNDQGANGSGGSQTDTDVISITVSPINPVVTSVTSNTANGSYKVGDALLVSVTFDQLVTVDTTGGTPSLLLETGSLDRAATYVSGSGSNTLVFSYTVQAGDTSGDLDYHSTAALALNGAVIKNVTNDLALLTLPGTGGVDSIAGQKDLVIDGVAPTVNSVAVPANGIYVAGQNLDFTVNLSEATLVDTSGGTPRIAVTLETGGTVYAHYLGGSGTNALTFRLTVASGQLDSNGISLASGIDTNGGSLTDSVGNNANTQLNNVDATSGVRIDAVAPTVTSVSVPAGVPYNAGDVLSFTVNTSELVSVNTAGGSPRLALDLGGNTVFAHYVAGSGSTTLVFQYTVQAGDNDADGIAVTGLQANGATLRDAAGNPLDATLNNLGDTSAVVVDTTAPLGSSIARVEATPTNAGTVHFTLTFSEGVSGVDSSDFALATTGTATGTISGVTQVDAQTYTITVSNIAGTGSLGLNLNSSNTGISDDAGNAIDGGLTGAMYNIDRDAPTVTSVTVPAGGTYTAGQPLDFTVNLNEATVVDTSGGTPRIAVTLDSGPAYANYLSGSGTNALTFRLVVATGQSDTNGISIASSIDPNGGSLKDGLGNVANSTLNNIGASAGILVDAVAPTVGSVSVPPGLHYNTGDVLSFTVNTSERVTVNTAGGTPRLALDVGGTTAYANYAAGSGTATLVFQYTVKAGDNNFQGLGGAIQPNGAILRDAAGNTMNVALNNVGDLSGIVVDTTGPSVTGTSLSGAPAPYASSVVFVVNFSEAVEGVDAADFALTATGTAVGSIGTISQVSATRWEVAVNNIQGAGNLRLDVLGAGISDLAANSLAAPFTSGASFTAQPVPVAVLPVQPPSSVTPAPAPAVAPSAGPVAPLIVLNPSSGFTGVLTSVDAPSLATINAPSISIAPASAAMTLPGLASTGTTTAVTSFDTALLGTEASAPESGGDGGGRANATGTINANAPLGSVNALSFNAAPNAFIERATATSGDVGLQAAPNAGSFNFQPGETIYVAIPANTFSANANAQLTVEVRQQNGDPLPRWLRFDPVTGTITGQAPKDFNGKVDIQVIVRDNKGNTATSNVEVQVGNHPQASCTAIEINRLQASVGGDIHAKPALEHQFARYGQQARELEANTLLKHLQAITRENDATLQG